MELAIVVVCMKMRKAGHSILRAECRFYKLHGQIEASAMGKWMQDGAGVNCGDACRTKSESWLIEANHNLYLIPTWFI